MLVGMLVTLANSNQYTAVVSIQGHVATLSTTTHRKNELTQMRDARDITSISRIMFGFCLDLNVHFLKKILGFLFPRGVEPLFAPCVDYLLVKIIYLLPTIQ